MRIRRAVDDRKGAIGFSSAAAHLGLSTRTSEYEAYLEFMGEPKEMTPEQQEACDMGHRLEPFVAQLGCERYGVKMRSTQDAFVNPRYPDLFCHPDRTIPGTLYGGDRVAVEIKTNSAFDRRWGQPDTDEIPMDYLVQCLGYFICGVPCNVVWLLRFTNNRLTRYIIRPNEKLQKDIAEALEEKVTKYRAGYVPSPSSYDEALAICNPGEGSVEADTAIREKISRLDELKEEIKGLEVERDGLKKDLVEFMDGKSILTIKGEPVMRYTHITQERFDSRRFKDEHPDLYAEYVKVNSFNRLS